MMLLVRVDEHEVDIASDWLWTLGATAIQEAPSFGADTLGPTEGVLLLAGFGDDDGAKAAHRSTRERWTVSLVATPDESEWRDVWLRHLTPVRVGPLVIHPPWREPTEDQRGDRAISIDPGRAFGSGHHASTQLAILGLSRVIQPGDEVLDVGCGSGVLSLAASALGAQRVFGIDLNHDIVEVAQANIEANGFAESVAVDTTPLERIDTGHDVVVANIIVGTLQPLLAQLSSLASRDLIVSGLLREHRARVEAALGTTADAFWTAGDWIALHFGPA